MYADQSCVYALRLSIEGAGYQLADHFRLIEAASKDGADLVLVCPALVDGLEALRERIGRPLHVNSWFRTVEHNARIGGARDSQHVRGLAADVTARGVLPGDVATLAEELGFGGVGIYASFVHVDVGPAGRRWRGAVSR